MQTNTDTLAWPPEYTVRKSRRAKSLQIKVSPEKGLEVVIPYRAAVGNVEHLLESHRPWILRKLAEYGPTIAQHENLPTQLDLVAIDQLWQIEYLSATGKPRCLPRPGQVLTVVGDLQNQQACRDALQDWVREKAKSHLVPWLRKLGAEMQLIPRNVSIREQRTRWGSCSSIGDININLRLIFLDARLANYIFIHELCHIRHQNHSARFWHLVAQYDPHFQQHRRELARLSARLGPWGLNSD
ncbi:MAG: M48 family metallopeptidase [Pseudomonadota bacterium]|nr:M48 family metallopeptidase [Pseudomonadota bacterium]